MATNGDIVGHSAANEISLKEDYACTLSDASLERARRELNENPDTRLAAVGELRTWIQQQPHLRCRTDTAFLLRFLRYCKFSQCDCHRRLQRYIRSMMKCPDWIADINPADPRILQFLASGFVVLLPGYDQEGRRIVLFRMGHFNPRTTDKDTLIRSCVAVIHHAMRQEDAQVNGLLYFMDLTGMTMKHKTFLSFPEMRRNANLFQNIIPVRVKGLHYYNMGPVALALLKVLLTFVRKKYRERVKLHGTHLASVQKDIPLRMLPTEYLPDDYEGPTAGSVQELTDSLVQSMLDPDIVEYIFNLTSLENFHIEETEPPPDHG